MKMKRITAMLLLAGILGASLASCGDGAEKPADVQTDSTTEEETEPLDALDARKLLDDGLGEHNFDGYKFRIVTYSGHGDHYYIEEPTGDTIDDAVYARNLAVEERFNCEITLASEEDTTITNNLISNTAQAGEDAYDLASYHVVFMGKLAPNGYFLNWYDIPNIDFTKPWWSASNINDLTHAGVCILAVGDMVLSGISGTYCTFYNKRLGQDYDMPDMFQAVDEGKFTFDYIVGLTKDIYVDLNQNGELDDGDDLFGYCSNCWSNMNAYLWSFDNPVFTNTSKGLEYVFKTEKVTAIADKLLNTWNCYDGIRAAKKYEHAYPMTMFQNSRCVFGNGNVGLACTNYRDLEDDFAILPYPKWDEAQKDYITMVDGSHDAMAVPTTAQNLERIGTIIEALNAESYKTLVPAYYDVALKVKGTRDEESVKILDDLVSSRVFDFGYVYDAWSGASFILQELMIGGNKNFESYYKSHESAITKYYNKVIQYFEEYGK